MSKVLHHRVGIDFADRVDLELTFPFVFLLRQEPPKPGRGWRSTPAPQSGQALVYGLTRQGEGSLPLRRARRRKPPNTPAGQIGQSTKKLLAFTVALELGSVTGAKTCAKLRQSLKFIFRHDPIHRFVPSARKGSTSCRNRSIASPAIGSWPAIGPRLACGTDILPDCCGAGGWAAQHAPNLDRGG